MVSHVAERIGRFSRRIAPLLVLFLAAALLVFSSRSAAASTNLFDTARADGRFGTLTQAVQRAGLEGMLRNNGPFTVLAPTDAAFAKLAPGALDSMSQTALRQTVLHHIIPGNLNAEALSGRQTVRTALGQELTLQTVNGKLVINGTAGVIQSNIQATNGIIHAIDAVLIPATASAAPPAGPAPAPAPAPGPAPAPPGGGAAPPPPATGPGATTTTVNITDNVALGGTKRFGMNIGGRDQYGAAQFLKNLLPNPGFESAEFSMVFITQPGTSNTRVQADNWNTAWNNDNLRIGQPQGFWNGARFEVATGPAKGRTGTVTNFNFENNLYTFYLSEGGATPNAGDVIIVRKNIGGYNFDTERFARADAGTKRPGSPGGQSMRLAPAPAGQISWSIGFDSYARDGDRSAGKLLVVQGNWTLDIWARASRANDKLAITFRRPGGAVFFQETVNLTGDWQRITRNFFVEPGKDGQIAGVPSALTFELNAVGGDVWVDDAILRRADYNNPTVFTDTYVRLLRELRPGILRNWGDQLGSSLDNQLAGEFARKPTGSDPNHRVARNYHYSLHEFLQLAREVGAEPWYVIPPTWSREEVQNLIAYLAAPAGNHPYADRRAAMGQNAPWTTVFNRIHLEYGNEIWGSNFGGDPFIGSSMRGGVRAGQVISDRFAAMKSAPHFNAGKFNLVISGQARFPDRQREFEANSAHHNTIAFAPYFGELQTWNNNTEKYNPLYAHAGEINLRSVMNTNRDILRQSNKGTGMAIYEINVHPITGPAPQNVRNEFVTSQGAGISVPLVMLTYLRDFGIRDQVGFEAAQFSRRLQDGQYVRLFGMLRDVEATARKRPTWLGIELANRAIGGDLLVTTQGGDNPSYSQAPFNGIQATTQMAYIQSFAFRQGNRYALVLFNVDINRAHNVQVNMPFGPSGNATQHTLAASSIIANNENANNVGIFTSQINNFRQGHTLTLAPHSMIVIEWTR
jgi:uncharacterized surface protein with fasciclin (FAS1) repeats/alpha-L-arabinofuranosidase